MGSAWYGDLLWIIVLNGPHPVRHAGNVLDLFRKEDQVKQIELENIKESCEIQS